MSPCSHTAALPSYRRTYLCVVRLERALIIYGLSVSVTELKRHCVSKYVSADARAWL